MKENLEHKLKNRHVQMIAIGGAVGTGLFLGSATVIKLTGPSVTLAYILGGLIVYAVMRALGEMTVDNPSSGSFVEYAHLYLGTGAGFVAGWNAWLLFTCACMLEVNAVATLLDYWVFIPHWITCATLLLIFGGVNLIGTKFFGEAEFWFAGIKVIAIIAIVLMGAYLIFTNHNVHQAARQNLHDYTHVNVFFTNGVMGFLSSMAIVCLSFCGVEFVSVAAGETEDPEKSIPKAINGVIIRVILFYVLTIAVVVLISNVSTIDINSNPFTAVFAKVGFSNSADIINMVAIIAALSALNSCIYGSSRFLYRLSLNGQAPKIFVKTNNKYLPKNAIVFTVAIAFVVVIANYTFPAKVLECLFAVISVAIIINWFIILLSHMLFRKNCIISGKHIKYVMPGYPYVNMLAMGVLFIILIVMSKNSDTSLSVYIAPAWLLVLTIIYTQSTGKSSLKLTNKIEN